MRLPASFLPFSLRCSGISCVCRAVVSAFILLSFHALRSCSSSFVHIPWIVCGLFFSLLLPSSCTIMASTRMKALNCDRLESCSSISAFFLVSGAQVMQNVMALYNGGMNERMDYIFLWAYGSSLRNHFRCMAFAYTRFLRRNRREEDTPKFRCFRPA